MTVVEVIPAVAKALQGSLNIFFSVFDGLQATEYVFGALVVATIFRLLLSPLIGGRAPNEIKLGSSEDELAQEKKKEAKLQKKNEERKSK